MKLTIKHLLLTLAAAAIAGNAGWAGEEAPAIIKLAEAFRAQCAAKFAAADKAGNIAVAGKDGWLFLTRELRHISLGTFWGEQAAKVSNASKPEWADPLPPILDFKAQMDKAGVELILVPVPPKAFIYPDKLDDAIKYDAQANPPVPRLDTAHQEFYKLLREKGVQVLDLADELLKLRKDEKKDQPLYCRTDTHWSPSTCELAARLLKERFKDRPWMPAGKSPFTTKTITIEVTGDLAQAAGGAGESLPARFVSETPAAPIEAETSPVLLMGDSHCLVFHIGGDMLGTNMGLCDQLAAELGLSIEMIGVRGSGATQTRITLMQRVRANEKYLSGKKLIIWCFTARDFTESQGWRIVPVLKQP